MTSNTRCCRAVSSSVVSAGSGNAWISAPASAPAGPGSTAPVASPPRPRRPSAGLLPVLLRATFVASLTRSAARRPSAIFVLDASPNTRPDQTPVRRTRREVLDFVGARWYTFRTAVRSNECSIMNQVFDPGGRDGDSDEPRSQAVASGGGHRPQATAGRALCRRSPPSPPGGRPAARHGPTVSAAAHRRLTWLAGPDRRPDVPGGAGLRLGNVRSGHRRGAQPDPGRPDPPGRHTVECRPPYGAQRRTGGRCRPDPAAQQPRRRHDRLPGGVTTGP